MHAPQRGGGGGTKGCARVYGDRRADTGAGPRRLRTVHDARPATGTQARGETGPPRRDARASFRRPNTAEEAASPRQPRLHLLGTLDTVKPRPKVHGPQPPGHGPRHARWRSGRRGRARGPGPVLARGDAVGLGALRGRHRTSCPRGGTHTPRRRRAGSAGSCQHRGDTADREEQQRRPTAPQPCLSAPRTKLENQFSAKFTRFRNILEK